LASVILLLEPESAEFKKASRYNSTHANV